MITFSPVAQPCSSMSIPGAILRSFRQRTSAWLPLVFLGLSSSPKTPPEYPTANRRFLHIKLQHVPVAFSDAVCFARELACTLFFESPFSQLVRDEDCFGTLHSSFSALSNSRPDLVLHRSKISSLLTQFLENFLPVALCTQPRDILIFFFPLALLIKDSC